MVVLLKRNDVEEETTARGTAQQTDAVDTEGSVQCDLDAIGCDACEISNVIYAQFFSDFGSLSSRSSF